MSLTTRPSSPAASRPAAPGTFRRLGDGDSLAWSEPVYRMHGFEPGEVVPSTALMLAHCHRDDRLALESVLRATPAGSADGSGRSARYRLLDAEGRERIVLAVLAPGTDPEVAAQRAAVAAPADPVPADDDVLARHHGLLVDLGAEIGATAAQRADDMLAAAIASREVIDQAKGVAMLAYGLDGDAAFELLRWHSEHLNVKVRTLAERLLATLPDRPADGDPRALLDAVLASLADPPGVATAGLRPAAPASPAGSLPAVLTVSHEVEGRSVVAHIVGEVDGATAPALVAGLATALRAVPARGTLVLDATRLRRVGPVAALYIGRLRRRAESAGVQLRIVPPPTPGRAEMRDGDPGSSM